MKTLYFLISLSISIHSTALADVTKTFGDWTVNIRDSSATISNTVIKDGKQYTIGLVCAGEDSCSFFLAQPVACENKKIYPAILTSKVGTTHIEMLCNAADENYFYKFLNDDLLTKAISEGGTLSLAMSLKKDFDVVRFNTDNAVPAIEYFLNIIKSNKKSL
jgi:hypothetical protein